MFLFKFNRSVIRTYFQDKTVIVADFGLARIISQTSSKTSPRRLSSRNGDSSLNSSGRRQERKKRYTVVGNPYWMAPEMMKGNKYDEKVDIFSYGIVLCEVIFNHAYVAKLRSIKIFFLFKNSFDVF